MKECSKASLEAERPRVSMREAVRFVIGQIENPHYGFTMQELVSPQLSGRQLYDALKLARSVALDEFYDVYNAEYVEWGDDDDPQDYRYDILEPADVVRYSQTLQAINYCLSMMYKDRRHYITDEICLRCTYEEVIGALLLARDVVLGRLQAREAAEAKMAKLRATVAEIKSRREARATAMA